MSVFATRIQARKRRIQSCASPWVHFNPDIAYVLACVEHWLRLGATRTEENKEKSG
jgi:hypothetical protein